jgi:superoxide reductase
VDAAQEKHIPYCEVNGDKLIVKVGSVEHPMTEEHYIMWIAYVANNKVTRVCYKPGDKIEETFEYVSGSKVYAYCNLHGLWMADVI